MACQLIHCYSFVCRIKYCANLHNKGKPAVFSKNVWKLFWSIIKLISYSVQMSMNKHLFDVATDNIFFLLLVAAPLHLISFMFLHDLWFKKVILTSHSLQKKLSLYYCLYLETIFVTMSHLIVTLTSL